MSMASHTTSSKQREHGTTRSYVIGFILSLVFTIIPYYLVVNKTFTGGTLLGIILGIAVLQMFIQIFFFLHLGRGPKPFYNVVFFFATAGLIVMVVGASVLIMNSLYNNMSPDEAALKLAQDEGIAQIDGRETGACQGNKDSHTVTIKDGVVSPAYVTAHRCDTLTIINADDRVRDIAFGTHPKHESYGGESEVVLRNGKSETITLNQLGEFLFHDHFAPTTAGRFSVTE
jgi:cytochrome o ubiquinol oxidase operon protein cyoD